MRDLCEKGHTARAAFAPEPPVRVCRYGTFGSTDAPNRDQLDLPATLVQGFSQLPVEICRPSFDALWEFGQPGKMDGNGIWMMQDLSRSASKGGNAGQKSLGGHAAECRDFRRPGVVPSPRAPFAGQEAGHHRAHQGRSLRRSTIMDVAALRTHSS